MYDSDDRWNAGGSGSDSNHSHEDEDGEGWGGGRNSRSRGRESGGRMRSGRRRSSANVAIMQEKEDLEEQNSSLLATCRELEDKCERLQEQLEHAERERDHAVVAEKRHKEELRASQHGRRDSTSSHATVGLRNIVKGMVIKKREERHRQIEDMSVHVEDLTRELMAAKQEAEEVQKELEALHEHIAELEGEVQTLKQDRDMAVCAGLQLNEELEELRKLVRARASGDGSSLGLAIAGELEGMSDDDGGEDAPPKLFGEDPDDAFGGMHGFNKPDDFESLGNLMDGADFSSDDEMSMFHQKSSLPIGHSRSSAMSSMPMGAQASLSVGAPVSNVPSAQPAEAAAAGAAGITAAAAAEAAEAAAATTAAAAAEAATAAEREEEKAAPTLGADSNAEAAPPSVARATANATASPATEEGSNIDNNNDNNSSNNNISSNNNTNDTNASNSNSSSDHIGAAKGADDAVSTSLEAANGTTINSTTDDDDNNSNNNSNSNNNVDSNNTGRPSLSSPLFKDPDSKVAQLAIGEEPADPLSPSTSHPPSPPSNLSSPTTTTPGGGSNKVASNGTGLRKLLSLDGDVGGSTGETSLEGRELERLWERHNTLNKRLEELQKEKAETEAESEKLKTQVLQLTADVERAERDLEELRLNHERERLKTSDLEARLANSVRPDAGGRVDTNSLMAGMEGQAACLTFADGDGAAQDSRKRAQLRKNKLKAWAEESLTKLNIGTHVKILRTITYRSARDPAKQYQLASGLRGVVVKLDDDGDAEVDWESIGKKWLLKKDFYKVTVEGRVTPTPSLAGSVHSAATKAQKRQRLKKAAGKAFHCTEEHKVAYFQVGEVYETRSDAILRAAEDLQSEKTGELSAKTKVTLLALGTASDRRAQVRCVDSSGEGWMSKTTQAGILLLGRVQPMCCPKGHSLKLIVGCAPGSCDLCGGPVAQGSQVMDCQSCNWYACSTCHPLEEGLDRSVRPASPAASGREALRARRNLKSVRSLQKRGSATTTAAPSEADLEAKSSGNASTTLGG